MKHTISIHNEIAFSTAITLLGMGFKLVKPALNNTSQFLVTYPLDVCTSRHLLTVFVPTCFVSVAQLDVKFTPSHTATTLN